MCDRHVSDGGFFSCAWAIDFALCITLQLKHGVCDGEDMGVFEGRGGAMSEFGTLIFSIAISIVRLHDV